MFGMPPLSVCKSGESRLVTDSEGFVFLSSEQPILVDYVGSGGDITLPEHFDARKYEIGHYAFKHISSITAVTVPSTVSVIGAGAFENCEELTAVTLLGAEVIGFAAFSECPSLCKISLNDGLREIGECAFQFCEKIVELDIPRSVTLIGRSALQYCESLERLSIPVCDIGDDRVDPREYYFGKLFGARDRIIQSVDSRPPRCLKELTLYGDIPDWSFVTAYGLRELTLVGARRIGDHAFYDLPRLERVVLPEGLAVIGYRAFAKCTSLEFLTLPEDVEIHKDAFVDCPLLTL